MEADVNIVEDLLAHRDRILFGEWVNGTPHQDGQACAVFYVEKGDFKEICDEGWSLLCNVLNRRGESLSVIDWNDDPDRTKEDVLGLLDDAIKLAKEVE